MAIVHSPIRVVYSVPTVDSAWDAGHAAGLAGDPARIPAGYGFALSESYCDGWRAGSVARMDEGPTTADELWWLGFQLGLDGIPAAAPSDLPPAHRAAFESGHDVGHARFIEDCEEEHRDWLDRLDSAYGNVPDMPEEEINWALSRRVAVDTEGGAL